MLLPLDLRALCRMILLSCIMACLFAGCGSSDAPPAASGDASADVAHEGAAGARGDGGSSDVSADFDGIEAGNDDATLDKSTADQRETTDVNAEPVIDAMGTMDASNDGAIDAIGTADAGTTDATDAPGDIDASDATPDASADGGLEIVAGGTYGPYVVQTIAINGATAGAYTFAIASPTAGTVTLRRDGTAVKTLDYIWQTTVSATDSGMFYTFDFPGFLAITIRKAGSGTMNLGAMDQSIFDSAHFLVVVPGMDGSTADGGTIPITAGGTYAPYVVESIAMTGAPNGAYTFHVTSPTAGSVELRRDGSPVTTLSYVWQTTVSATDSNMFYTFQFAGYFSITIRKAGTGTMNLYAMDQSIFDGAHVLTVTADGGGAD